MNEEISSAERVLNKGQVVAVQGPVVDVKFERIENMPDLH
jgi:F0F1-type ATP synthase beta subunit